MVFKILLAGMSTKILKAVTLGQNLQALSHSGYCLWEAYQCPAYYEHSREKG